MKTYKNDKEIALLLCRAQVASDGGKGGLFGRPTRDDKSLAARDFRAGYSIKDECILQAVALIAVSRSSFSFYIDGCDDPATPIANAIIYFNFKIDGKRHQMSFHSLNGPEFWSFKKTFRNEKHRTRWQGGHGGSGRAAMDLVAEYDLDYRIW